LLEILKVENNNIARDPKGGKHVTLLEILKGENT